MPIPSKSPKRLLPFEHSLITRAVHWILSRMGLFQTIIMFMWLAERIQHNTEPPFQPWVIYVHAAVGLIASTGLSARFLARVSLYALTAVQLHTAYLCAFESNLNYPRWLRTRVALRSLAAGAIYLRMLGVQVNSDEERQLAESPKSHSGSYAIGLTLMAIFTGLTGLLSFPGRLFQIDRNAQLIEQTAHWPLLAGLAPWINFCLGLCFCMASLLHTVPLVVTWNLLPSHSHIQNRMFRLGDFLTLIGLVALLLVRDSHVQYWMVNGCEFWLHCHLLLNSFIIFAGILVTADLSKASERHGNVKRTKLA
ncbi:hypothetical protein P879_07465 [Paragonimus westermani]|uniref:Uncharacterized protein n=1 Tax=Paragonimus westermani TaxID=34504 RepID=A0A8T0DLH1_9TREM|nr:hypothetical protein P879_07465 [Paragonimus westermani]